ncbi:ribosomal RNA small subunit methyltransferase B [Pediococcus claussenii ATCC BAA-344]|uniref:16S rRNA (cytosine(967)-C(5))-methyltransferase n=1 Tax=Pediococcus claussenii (strain ATCC BAA-344 / DSM 14800 / JCM 18046 / KCTC 3811 / LMG 21948 / P06) TaxID=701521 RepID=G8PDI3_PEDCP|nr:ribosomal RNA small subunit methyltransferase B [Pediococcus claussenii ATCC BAA-344]KRN19500.1 sun protein [Pediococcus claussenii]
MQVNNEIEQHDLKVEDKRLITELVYGVLQNQLTLDYYLSPFLKKPQKLQNWVRNLLRTAVYQMKYLDRIPEFAILNESTEIAKKRGHDGIRRMVTGVLRSIERQGIPNVAAVSDPIERLSVEYSVKKWIIKQLINELGQKKTVSILKSINTPSKLSIRVNTVLSTTEKVTKGLEKEGFSVERSQVGSEGLILERVPYSLSRSELFQKGDIIAQDESAMLVAEVMDVKDGMKVLDACAAPGGKTTQIAEYVGQNGKVVAWDIHDHRLDLIKKNARRMQLSDRIEVEKQDASIVDDQYDNNTFDRILVDAPCSGIGLLRRKPEIRYVKDNLDPMTLHKIQLSILDAIAEKLKIDGILTYSTCTMLDMENQGTVKEFLEKHSNFELVKVKTDKSLKDDRELDTLNIFPDDFGSDGFFIANLKRVR